LTEDGVAFAAAPTVVVTLATAAYFAAESVEEQEGEYCQWISWFAGAVVGGELTPPTPYDMNAQEFDWEGGVGGSGVTADTWEGAAWEGGLGIYESTMTDRCADWEGADYNLFHGMHYGVGFGDLSSELSERFDGYTWWDSEVDPYSYFTMYTAMNHPNEESALGYDFVGYDFSSGLYISVDESVCVEVEDAEGEVTEVVCGQYEIEPSEDGSGFVYKTADFREDIGSRYAYVSGNASWYEDFPNLDLTQLKEGFEFDGAEEE
jgi:hypothetical protein